MTRVKQLAEWIPAFTRPPHQLYVTRLYRKALRLCADWYWEKLEYREKAHMIRQMFEQNRNEQNPKRIDQLLQEAEFNLAKYYNPVPFKYPTAPGGTKWERNAPVPEEVCKMGGSGLDHN